MCRSVGSSVEGDVFSIASSESHLWIGVQEGDVISLALSGSHLLSRRGRGKCNLPRNEKVTPIE